MTTHKPQPYIRRLVATRNRLHEVQTDLLVLDAANSLLSSRSQHSLREAIGCLRETQNRLREIRLQLKRGALRGPTGASLP